MVNRKIKSKKSTSKDEIQIEFCNQNVDYYIDTRERKRTSFFSSSIDRLAIHLPIHGRNNI